MTPKKVLIAGGGVAALEAALALRALAEDRVDVELVAPEPHFWYRPLAVAEPFKLGTVKHFDLAQLASDAGAAFSLGMLTGVDSRGRVARTEAGAEIPYDALLVACGARPKRAIPGALTFRGPADTHRVTELLEDTVTGQVRRIAFVVPWGAVWSLPIYELALMTASYLAQHDVGDAELVLVTPEDEPLEIFGSVASKAVRALLDERAIALHTRSYAAEVTERGLRLVPERTLATDHVVALPRLRGQRIDGLPQTVDGFLPVDPGGRVEGVEGVFGAGDITTFPVKQGGIAAQQADAAAEAIAADAGAELTPRAFRPVLRGLLLTGGAPRYLRHELAGGSGETSSVDPEPLWWPPAKIVGRYLAPFLNAYAGVAPASDDASPPEDAVAVELDLATYERAQSTSIRLDLVEASAADEATVADVMSTDLLLVAPEDTLGEIAEKMSGLDIGSAVVADYGRLIGILTARDFLRAFAGRVHSSDARAREWMTAQPVAVAVDTPLTAAVALMTAHGFHHLPIVDGERPIGMVGLRQAIRGSARGVGVGLGL